MPHLHLVTSVCQALPCVPGTVQATGQQLTTKPPALKESYVCLNRQNSKMDSYFLQELLASPFPRWTSRDIERGEVICLWSVRLGLQSPCSQCSRMCQVPGDGKATVRNRLELHQCHDKEARPCPAPDSSPHLYLPGLVLPETSVATGYLWGEACLFTGAPFWSSM